MPRKFRHWLQGPQPPRKEFPRLTLRNPRSKAEQSYEEVHEHAQARMQHIDALPVEQRAMIHVFGNRAKACDFNLSRLMSVRPFNMPYDASAFMRNMVGAKTRRSWDDAPEIDDL